MSPTPPGALTLRPMEPGDVAIAVDVSAAAFEYELTDAATRAFWEMRVAHPLRTDPGGAFVAELDGRLVGVAQALQRDRVWVLTLLTVLPTAQSTGAGRALFERALDYGERAAPGLIVSSNDARAMRLYARAGFSLLAALETDGLLQRRALPRPNSRIREAGHADLGALEMISRAVRGATHTPDLELALRQEAVLLRLGDAGFAAAMPGHGVWMLAARHESDAQALLWQALEIAGESVRPAVRWLAGDQAWAIDVLLRAGFGLRAYGALAVRGRPGPLRPYIPSGPFA
ncbi:MAG TPA: GNAT family N-acetyltransferase [Solirubrobacteraceae bacterium]|nr:GNAT family N-acetyltransferase [Solirubrobacteraceae bacterium]